LYQFLIRHESGFPALRGALRASGFTPVVLDTLGPESGL
jgi:hypothetical protein